MIVVIDNTPFPDGNTQGLSDLLFSSSYQIQLFPNERYFTITLVLCIVFGALLLIGTAALLSMRR